MQVPSRSTPVHSPTGGGQPRGPTSGLTCARARVRYVHVITPSSPSAYKWADITVHYTVQDLLTQGVRSGSPPALQVRGCVPYVDGLNVPMPRGPSADLDGWMLHGREFGLGIDVELLHAGGSAGSRVCSICGRPRLVCHVLCPCILRALIRNESMILGIDV